MELLKTVNFSELDSIISPGLEEIYDFIKAELKDDHYPCEVCCWENYEDNLVVDLESLDIRIIVNSYGSIFEGYYYRALVIYLEPNVEITIGSKIETKEQVLYILRKFLYKCMIENKLW